MPSSYTVCIVEEETETILALQNSLQKLGCKTHVSDGSEAGIEGIVREHKIEIVFLPLCLRHSRLRTVVQIFKRENPFTKIFLVTRWEGEFDSDILQAEGLAGVIRKPPRFIDVKRAVFEHVG